MEALTKPMDETSEQRKLLGFEFWEKKLKSAKLIVAPMVDQSELAWRLLSRRYGAQLCYTPMYHASVFVRDANYRRDALASCKEDRPLIIQFCANDPDMLLRAARYAEKHCEAIDLNLGCPQAIAKRGHYGAFLQDEWQLLEKMVSLCAKELQVPITCKIRIFEDMDKTVRYAQMLEKAGCQLLTVHGRTKEQKGPDTGIADWKYIKAIKEAVHIPVFANGNIQYLSDVHRCLRQTGVEGVMTAESNLHNPALFDGLQHSVWDMAGEYLALVHQYPCPMAYIRGHMFKLLHHVLLVHTSQREVLGNCKLIPEVEKFVRNLKELSQPDMTTCEEDPMEYKEMYQGSLTYPYWICQPYVRPTPEETEQKQRDKLNGKRPLGEVLNGPEEKPLSRNKLKKLRRNPCKKFEERREKFQKCETCGNPKGLKCVLDLCKACCKKIVNKEKLDCPGHKLLARTRYLLQLKLQQEATEASSGSGNLVTDSTDSQGDPVPTDSQGDPVLTDLQADPVPTDSQGDTALPPDIKSASITERDRETSVKHDTCVTDIGTLSMHSNEANCKSQLDIFHSAGETFQETPTTSNVEAR